MKHLKTFEGREKSDYGRDSAYKHLEIGEEKLLEIFISDYIKKLNILDKIDSLTLSELDHERFQYRTIFNNLIGINVSYNSPNSFYRNVDDFIKDNKINSSSQVNRNSVFKIEDKIYKYYKPELTEKLDNIIIKFLSKINSIKKMKEYYEKNSDCFSSKVKREFEFIIKADKFNL